MKETAKNMIILFIILPIVAIVFAIVMGVCSTNDSHYRDIAEEKYEPNERDLLDQYNVILAEREYYLQEKRDGAKYAPKNGANPETLAAYKAFVKRMETKIEGAEQALTQLSAQLADLNPDYASN